jgi:hypothetical protein
MGGEFVVGQRVGDYQVLFILGFGGLGKVTRFTRCTTPFRSASRR